MLRRGYTYDNGAADQGLLFLAYMRDPTLFTRVRERLTTRDDLHPYAEHRASALAYVPRPRRPASTWGSGSWTHEAGTRPPGRAVVASAPRASLRQQGSVAVTAQDVRPGPHRPPP